MRIIVPKRFYKVEKTLNERVYFLAGPIRGGGDWQEKMCRIIDHIDSNPIIVCPCRWDDPKKEDHPLKAYFVGEDTKRFGRQLSWERYYLELAGVPNPSGPSGCILFWLPIESEENPHEGPEPYAMDTRGELGEWRMRMKYEKARVVIGADPEFYGLSQIQRNYTHVLGRDFPIESSMEQTAYRAMSKAFSM